MSAHPFHSVEIAGSRSPDGLLDLTVGSPALGRRVDLSLFTPAGVDPDAELPVVVLLHGVYGSHSAWSRSGHAHATLQALVHRGEIAPAVLAMPSDGLYGVGSGYLDRFGEDADQWITHELPQAVHLIHPRAGAKMSIAGLSMGGWGALRLAARHPGRYTAAVGFSPLTHLDQVAGYAPVDWAARHALATDDPALLPLLIRQRDVLPPMKITCGTEDELLDSVRALHTGLSNAGIDHEYGEAPGGHDWRYWTDELADALRFIDRRG